MAPRRIEPADLASVLPPGGRTLVMGCAGESLVLNDAVMAAGDAVGAMTFTGIFIPGVNRRTYLANPDCRLETFFITPEIKAAPAAQVRFMPMCYDDVLKRLRTIDLNAALMSLSPPDADGLCSFGNTVDFVADIWERIPVRIAHINPAMPRTRGPNTIPMSALTAWVEAEQPLITTDEGEADAVAEAIAGHIAPLVCDGATLQAGLGKVPGAVLRALRGKRNLRMFSGLVTDAVLDLIEAGALAPGTPVTAGCAIGSQRLYDAIDRGEFSFHPVSVTHSNLLIAQVPHFVAVNSALEVDLFGQAYSELGPKGVMSGPGGASDYARAARLSAGGLRVVALAASAAKGTISRIVPPNSGAGPIALGRMDIDFVVTEFGAADLRGRGYDDRAEALIMVAPPAHREALREAWQTVAARL